MNNIPSYRLSTPTPIIPRFGGDSDQTNELEQLRGSLQLSKVEEFRSREAAAEAQREQRERYLKQVIFHSSGLEKDVTGKTILRVIDQLEQERKQHRIKRFVSSTTISQILELFPKQEEKDQMKIGLYNLYKNGYINIRMPKRTTLKWKTAVALLSPIGLLAEGPGGVKRVWNRAGTPDLFSDEGFNNKPRHGVDTLDNTMHITLTKAGQEALASE
jgi:hypothetical protein